MSTSTLAHHDAHHDADLRRRTRPSREQLRVAAAIFTAATEDVTSVVVPIVVPVVAPGSDHGGWATERPFEYPGGYWLADRGRRDGAYGWCAARDAAEAAAAAHLRAHGRRGVPGWVSIRPDGTWAAFDAMMTAVR